MGAAVGNKSLWCCWSRVDDGEAVDIISDDAGTVVPFVNSQMDVTKHDIVGMSQVEAPGGKFLEHRKLGVLSSAFRYCCQRLGVGAAKGIAAVTAAGVVYLDIFEGDVFNPVSGGAHDGGRRNVARQILHRTLVAVACIRLLGWYFHIYVFDDDILQAGGYDALAPFGETKEDSVASMGCA